MLRRSHLRFTPALIGVYLAVSTIVTLGGGAAHAGASSRYAGGGTAVSRNGGQTAADEGSVVCDNGEGQGVGGFCLPFGGGNAIAVLDDAAGENVAYQACVDNNGDGFCTSPDDDPTCPDQIAFSHDDAGSFFNPLGPLPTGFLPGCTGGSFGGYVVFLCQGAHVLGHDAGHTHSTSTGTGSVTTGGEGTGTFCGGSTAAPSSKQYFLGGGRYVAGGTTVVRNNGEPTTDEGSVVCDNGKGVGAGGFCLPFGSGDAIAVSDDALGPDVAYQVCVDNNGDGFCTSPDFDQNCPDQIAFSHDDGGTFFNPLGPLPTGFLPGCSGGAWNGYVVFLCQGVHADTGSGHSHQATTGEGKVTTGGEGLGTFCGGTPVQQSRKPYGVGGGVDGKGKRCSLASAKDPTTEGSTQTGTIQGGPVGAPGFGGGPTSSTTLTCTVQVGSRGGGGGAQAVSVSASGIGFAILLPVTVSFSQFGDQPVYVCTTVTVDGTTYEFDEDSGEYVTGGGASCRQATSPDPGPPTAPQPLGDLLAQLRNSTGPLVAAAVCPLLALLFPPDGTVLGLGCGGIPVPDTGGLVNVGV